MHPAPPRTKVVKWIHRSSTALLALIMYGSGTMYLLNPGRVAENMIHLGYPTYLVQLLIVPKFLGITVILLDRWPRLTEWAYSAYFFNAALAVAAHAMAGDPLAYSLIAILAVISVLASYFSRKRTRDAAVAQYSAAA